MKSSPFKSLYRFGGTVFIISVIIMSLIFGSVFKSCSTDNIVTVNLNNQEKKKDTIFIERQPEQIKKDTVRIIIQPKINTTKIDTLKK